MADLKYIVRIANTDLDGKKPIGYTLTKIKGIGFMCARAVCTLAAVDPATKTGALSDEQTKKLNDISTSLHTAGLPAWMLNRRRDPVTGENTHLLTSNLKLTQENDIKMMKKIKSYCGMRHAAGLPVRGQRTKSNFRKNKGKVMGVKRAKTGKKAGK